VLLPGYPPSGAGLTARAIGESANDASISAMRRTPRRAGDLPIDFIKRRVVIFSIFLFVEVGSLTAIQVRTERKIILTRRFE
jgi:hypothetical protein